MSIHSTRIPRVVLAFALAGALLSVTSSTLAHHSYAMFDTSKHATVIGTVAKLEWINPHVYVWMYVPSKNEAGKYDLYAFENGSINALTHLGWNATVLKAGDKITLDYWPLKDGRLGGHVDKAKLADGRVLLGAGAASGAPGKAPRPELDLPSTQPPKP